MPDERDMLFSRYSSTPTMGALPEIIMTLVDGIIVGHLFDDAVFASVNLTEQFIGM